MLQVRNLPDDVHERLKARAAEERMSLSDYVARELTKLVEYRSNAEILADYRRRHPPTGGPRIGAELVRAARAEREEEREAWLRGEYPNHTDEDSE